MKAIKLRQQAFYQGHFKSGIRILTTGIKMGVTPCKCETKVPSSVDQVEARGHGPHGRWAGAKGYSYFSRSNFWQSGAAAAENSPIAHRLSPERARTMTNSIVCDVKISASLEMASRNLCRMASSEPNNCPKIFCDQLVTRWLATGHRTAQF